MKTSNFVSVVMRVFVNLLLAVTVVLVRLFFNTCMLDPAPKKGTVCFSNVVNTLVIV